MTILLSHHRIVYTFNISYALKTDLLLIVSQDLDNFEFILAKESTRADQRNRLFPTSPNPNISRDFERIDSIPSDTIGRQSPEQHRMLGYEE